MTEDGSAEAKLSAQLAGYRDRLTALSTGVADLAAGLAPADWRWSPSPRDWSIGQCLEHINIVNSLLVPRIEAAIADARARGWTGRGPFRYSITDRIFISTLAPEAGLKARAPGIYRPNEERVAAAHQEPDGNAGLPRFQELQARLLRAVEHAEGLDLKRAKVASPVSRLIQVSLGAWFEAIIEHERNHLQQAQRVAAAMNEGRV